MSKVDLVLLGLLSEQPRHGYDIKQQIEQRHMREWVGITPPGIYKGLARLERTHALSAHRESSSSHPDRTVYTITPEGRQRFESLLHESIAEPDHPYFKLLMGFGFAHLADREALLSSLEAKQASLEKILVEVDALKVKMREEGCFVLTAKEIVQYYIDLIEMERHWLKRVIELIAKVDPWPEGVLKP